MKTTSQIAELKIELQQAEEKARKEPKNKPLQIAAFEADLAVKNAIRSAKNI